MKITIQSVMDKAVFTMENNNDFQKSMERDLIPISHFNSGQIIKTYFFGKIDHAVSIAASKAKIIIIQYFAQSC